MSNSTLNPKEARQIMFGLVMVLALVLITVATSAYSQNFKKDVAPVLEQQCLPCHNASKAAGGLALTSRKALLDRKSVV